MSLYSGAETVDANDLVVKGVFPIRVHRQYDSQTDYDSPLGHGWAFEFDRRLYQYPDNSVVVRYGCGLKDKYTYSGGTYVPPPGAGRLGTLTQQSDGTFQLTYLNGIRDYYDVQGRLTAARDPQGNRQEFTYDPRGKLPLMGTSKHALDPTASLTVAYNYRLTRIDERAADGTLTGHFLTLTYDDTTGRLTTVTSSDGRSVTYIHDVQTGGTTRGNLTRVNGLTGIVSDYQYNDPNDLHNLTQDTPILGKTAIVNTYDTQDRITRQVESTRQLDFEYTVPLTKTKLTTTVKDANGANPYTIVENYEFDPSGKITKRTDGLGDEFRYTVNPAKLYSRRELWQMNSGTLAFLQATDWTYDAAGNVATETFTLSSGESITRSWTYDHNWIASRQAVSSAAPAKLFRTEYTFNYDSEGLPVTVQSEKRRRDDGSFETTTYSYDGRNRLIATTFPDGVQAIKEYTGEWITKTYFKVGGVAIPQLVHQFDYDGRGFQTKVYDGRGNLTQYDYDDIGRVTTITDPLGQQTINTYTDFVKTQVEIGHTAAAGDGQVTKFIYDARNRLTGIQRKDDSGNFVTYVTYQEDSEGHVLSITDAVNRTTSLTYDLRGRVQHLTDPAGKTSTFAYDAASNQVSAIDPLGHETRSEYDVLNRRTAIVQLGVTPNPRTQFTYDAAGNRTSATDAEGHTTRYLYDALSRLTSVTQPLGQTVQYTYDNRDRLTQKITARNQKIAYTYEDWGPVKLEQRYSTSTAATPDRTISFLRDNDGNVLSETDDGVQASPLYSSTYDSLNRLYDETVNYLPGGPVVLHHRYDRFGNRSALTLQDAAPVTYSYTINKLNQISSAILAGDTVGISYYANDNWQTVTMPNGLTRSYTFKANGPVDTITVNGPGGQIAQYVHTYDDALNTSTMSDPDGTHTYSYDGLNRLIQAIHPAASGLTNENYAYDRVGNRRDPSNQAQWTYDSNNRITQGGALTYSFDADGNVATRSDGATYTHDQANMLVGYNNSTTYLYDPVGRRIRKTVGGTPTWFLWDGLHLLAEYDGAGNRTIRYGYMPGQAAALQVQDANGTYYAHADGTHAPRILTNSTGAIVWRAQYQGYGAAVIGTSTITYNQSRPGQYRDIESGLVYNYWRHYDPAIGRYVQKDPIGIGGGLNVYAYAAGNPTTRWDLVGLCPNDVIPGIPDRTPPYTTQGPFTAPDGHQWYTFTANSNYEFDKSATDYSGTDASKAFTAPENTIRDSSSVPPTDANGNPNEPIQRISISDSGEVRKGGPPDVAVPSTAPPPPPPTAPPPPNLEPPPHVEIPEPNIEINFPD